MRIVPIVVFSLLHLTAWSQELLIAAKESGKKFGFINTNGQYVIPPSFDDATPFMSDVAVVRVGKKYGVIDRKGAYTIKPVFDDALYYFPEGKITVKSKGKWGIVSAQGDTIVPFRFAYASIYNEGTAVVGVTVKNPKSYRDKVRVFFADSLGNIAGYKGEESAMLTFEEGEKTFFLPGQMIKGQYQDRGWPIVRSDKILLNNTEAEIAYDVRTEAQLDLYGYSTFDHTGFRENLMPCITGDPVETGGDRDVVYLRANPGEFNYSPAFTLKASHAYPFFNGVAAVASEGKWIFIDNEGWVISRTGLSTEEYKANPPMYFNGLIGFVNSKDKVGFVNIKGETVIPFEFDEYHPFEYDVTPAKYKGSYGLLKKDGTWAVEPRFETLDIGPCPCFK
jgi:hypothetical protein